MTLESHPHRAAFWRAAHDAHHALHDIIDVGEITPVVAMVVDLDRISGQQLEGRIAASQQLVAFSCGDIQGDRPPRPAACRSYNFADAAAGAVEQTLHGITAGGPQNNIQANEIGIHAVDAVLCGEINDNSGAVGREDLVHRRLVGNGAAEKDMLYRGLFNLFFNIVQPAHLQRGVI